MKISQRALGAVLAASVALPSAAAFAKPPAGHPGHGGPMLPAYQDASPAKTGKWTAVAGFPGSTPGTSLLMTDGTVLVHDECTSDWYRLTADPTGSYVNGTWTKAASMPSGYAPLYFASSVLPDGRLLVNGGEYNGSGCPSSPTKLGALFDPAANSWTSVQAPSGWGSIYDAASIVLPNGDEMLQSVISGTMEAIATVAPLPGTTVTWAATGAGKADGNDEEGWTLLPTGDVLTVDTNRNLGQNTPAELYSPTTGRWTGTATAPVVFVDPPSHEIGPAVLLPSGNAFQIGANSCGKAGCAGHTGVYASAAGTWSAGPDLPTIAGQSYDVTDGPAAILPNGHVLVQASPAYTCGSAFCAPSHFFDYDGTTFTQVDDPASAPQTAAYEGRMLVLPTGQILWDSTFEGDLQAYTPKGSPNKGWVPAIKHFPSAVTRGQTNYVLTGHRFHGVSDGAAYGDDAQMNSAYPIVRLTSSVDGHVCFAHVHDHTDKMTSFDIPAASPPAWERACTPGAASLTVVVNGIASAPVSVTIN